MDSGPGGISLLTGFGWLLVTLRLCDTGALMPAVSTTPNYPTYVTGLQCFHHSSVKSQNRVALDDVFQRERISVFLAAVNEQNPAADAEREIAYVLALDKTNGMFESLDDVEAFILSLDRTNAAFDVLKARAASANKLLIGANDLPVDWRNMVGADNAAFVQVTFERERQRRTID